MKKKITLVLILVLVAGIFALVFFFSQKTTSQPESQGAEPLRVTVQSVSDSVSLVRKIEYPAVTAGDQEVSLTAQSAGTITQLNFDLGSKVFQNMRLATIDSIGNFSSPGENDLQNSSIQALELTVESAEESYKIAKDKYETDDSYANKKSKSIAKLNLEIAESNLDGALDSRFAVSPIAGTITERLVSQGDSVTVGQKLATISKTGLTKVKFYVDKEDLPNFKYGKKITINEDGNEIPGVVSKVAPQADTTTRRFLIEARPQSKTPLLIGNVISVSVEITKTPVAQGNLLLPLSVITIGQNENYIFIAENSKAKKASVEIVKVIGEYAEIKADLPSEGQIIMDGSKLVKDGEEVAVSS